MKKLITPFIIMLLSGCSVLPYESEFQCPNEAGTGKCISVDGAYQEAVEGKPEKAATQNTADNDENNIENVSVDSREFDALYKYEDAQFNALSGLLREPETPIVQQAKIVRTLILAYPDSPAKPTRLYMPRFVYSIEQNPRFVFGHYKLQEDMGIDLFKSLGGGGK